MLSALLGAICAVSMACAPALVEPSSNLINNDGGFTSLHSAYYDADNVSGYGTEAGYAYNFSSINLQVVSGSASASTVIFENQSLPWTYVIDDTPVFVWNGYSDTPHELDIYLNGSPVSYTTTTVSHSYQRFFVETANQSTDYLWIFDHKPYQLGTDTVADIAEGLTDGIGTVATGIGGGLQSLVRNIFLVGTYDADGNFTATGLSTFGIVTIVMASLALALGLSRWVVGWCSSLGERNR